MAKTLSEEAWFLVLTLDKVGKRLDEKRGIPRFFACLAAFVKYPRLKPMDLLLDHNEPSGDRHSSLHRSG